MELPEEKVGKVKKIFCAVVIENTDSITSGDGDTKDRISGKAVNNTAITKQCFQLLSQEVPDIPNHFIQHLNDWSFLAVQCIPLPFEVVVRRYAFGSYCKRYPLIKKGTELERCVEFFLKDDGNHDPFIEFTVDGGCCFHKAGEELQKYPDEIKHIDNAEMFFRENYQIDISHTVISTMREYAGRIFEVLEKAFENQGCILIDLKLEFGVHAETNEVVLIDGITPDEWRLVRKSGKKITQLYEDEQLSKQVYRAMRAAKKNPDEPLSEEEQADISRMYTECRKLTDNFLIPGIGF